MSARPRLALIGCGRIGQVHLRSLLSMPDLCDLAVLADLHEPSVHKSADTFGIDRWTTDVDSRFNDTSIDAVIIASSTEIHGTFIAESARAGKDAVIEKPIALEAVSVAGTRLQIEFQRRFETGYRAARDKIESGELGRIEFIRGDAMRDPEPPPLAYAERSGGLYRDMTIHYFDCVRWLIGPDPIEVFGLAGAVFVGESHATPIRTFGNGVHEDHQHFFLDRFGNAFRSEMVSFVEAIRNDTPVAVSSADGRAACTSLTPPKHRAVATPL